MFHSCLIADNFWKGTWTNRSIRTWFGLTELLPTAWQLGWNNLQMNTQITYISSKSKCLIRVITLCFQIFPFLPVVYVWFPRIVLKYVSVSHVICAPCQQWRKCSKVVCNHTMYIYQDICHKTEALFEVLSWKFSYTFTKWRRHGYA